MKITNLVKNVYIICNMVLITHKYEFFINPDMIFTLKNVTDIHLIAAGPRATEHAGILGSVFVGDQSVFGRS